MDTRLKTLLWFGVSTGILVSLVYLADPGKVLSALSSANLVLLPVAMVTGLSASLVFGYTWYRFLNQVGPELSYLKSLRMFLAGQFTNDITPFGQAGGEPLMAYVIQRNTGLSYEKAFSAVLSADIINSVPGFTFMIAGAFYLFLAGSLNNMVVQTLSIAVVVLFIGSSIVYLLWFRSGYIEGLVLRLVEMIVDLTGRGSLLLEKLEEKMLNVEEAFRTIGENPSNLLSTAAVAHSTFLLQTVSLYIVINSISTVSPLVPLFFVLAVASLANFTPTPGGTGSYEAALAGILTFFTGLELADATVIAIVYRALLYWPAILIGYLALVSLGGEA